ncbi:hypothetical protein [Streptomyces chattanoogensis]|nr:hypothetical protein T261_8524 [Streptomyces lydicus]
METAHAYPGGEPDAPDDGRDRVAGRRVAPPTSSPCSASMIE